MDSKRMNLFIKGFAFKVLFLFFLCLSVVSVQYSCRAQEAFSTQIDLEQMKAQNLLPVKEQILEGLPDTVSGGRWDSKNVIQGVEWNTDSMDRVYFSYAKYIVAYTPNGELLDEFHTDHYFTGLDYYNGKLFATWRREDGKNFEYRVYVFNAKDLNDYYYVTLSEVNTMRIEDGERMVSDSVKAGIDGITVARQFGSDSDELKLYVSYGAWDNHSEGMLSVNEYSILLEYDLDDVMNGEGYIAAERRLEVKLGAVKYCIQQLEYDRDTGNVWCSIRKGDQYSLFSLAQNSVNTTLDLIPNGSKRGWECEEAGDGFCSLGNDAFYVLIPNYGESFTSGVAKKVSEAEFEDIS